MATVTAADAPEFLLHFQGKNITEWVTPEALTISFTDALEDESDSLDVTLMDPNQKWCGAWWPGQGDVLELQLGKRGRGLRRMGSFVLDEITHSGPPDVISLRALGAPTDRALRSNRHAGYENTTLPAIAAEVAARNGLTVSGDLAQVPVGRITQADETDVEFLRRIAHDYGYIFSIKDGALVFQDVSRLHGLPALRDIGRGDLFGWSLAARQSETPESVSASYWEPEDKAVRVFSAPVSGGRSDTKTIRVRAENELHAARIVEAETARAVCGSITGQLNLDGDPDLRAGVNVTLNGMGALDGRYRVDRATHKVDRGGGYTTDIEVSKLP